MTTVNFSVRSDRDPLEARRLFQVITDTVPRVGEKYITRHETYEITEVYWKRNNGGLEAVVYMKFLHNAI